MQEKKRGRTHSRWLLPAALVLAGAAWFENFTLSTSTVTAACAALPEAFSGLRIVQISDLHGRRFDAESRYLLELAPAKSGSHRPDRRSGRRIHGLFHAPAAS